jgi:hypothetical protein
MTPVHKASYTNADIHPNDFDRGVESAIYTARKLLDPIRQSESPPLYQAWMRFDIRFWAQFFTREALHNSLRSALARHRTLHSIAFLANSQLLAAKKRRLVAYLDPHHRRLPRVMQSIPRNGSWTHLREPSYLLY